MLRLPQKVLKLACWVLGAVLAVQIALLIKHANPLKRLSIPALPTLAAAAEAQSGGKGTNSVAGGEADKKGTNAVPSGKTEKAGTNAAASRDLGKQGTNTAAVKAPGTNGTNAVSARTAEKEATNMVAVEEADKNETKPPPEKDSEADTNSVVITKAGKSGTNSVTTMEGEKTGTNSVEAKSEGSGTNSSQAQKSGKAGTNTVASKETAKKGKPGGPRQDAGKALADLPPRIKTRVEYITQSEILGQIVRPMPMALLGIADKDVFLRAPDGQTGTIKQGGELGGVKLLRVGTNRILIEYEGEKKELTIFSGLGSETLLPKVTEKTNEITKKTP